MGEAAVKLRMLKAKYLKAADDYNIEHLIEGQWLGPITRAHMKILEAIVGFVCTGRIHPGYEAIAHVAKVRSLSTVGVAISRLRAAGLLTWWNQWQWNDLARKVTKTANHYSLNDLISKNKNQSAPQQASKKGAAQVNRVPLWTDRRPSASERRRIGANSREMQRSRGLEGNARAG